jgi:hypothetical protein
MNVRIIPMLLLCCVMSLAQAEDVQLQDNPPERYVVVKGDTLWAISGRFLKDPWRWPQVWKMNRQQIKNPHLIYPGDVIVLDTSSGTPELRLLRQTVTLAPGIREEDLEKESIHSIAPSAIAPFLSQPLVIDKNVLDSSPTIVAGDEQRVLYGAGNRVYADRIDKDWGRNWQIYQQGNALIDPDTKEVLGYEAIYLGDAQATRFGEPATINITRSKQEVQISDKLVKMPDTLMSSFIPHAPEGDVAGRIISVYKGVTEASINSIVTINRGKADGMEEGHVLAVASPGMVLPKKNKNTDPRNYIPQVNLETYRDTDGKMVVNFAKENKEDFQIKLPDERTGLIMIFRTFEHVSYALVMQSELPIHLLDIVRTP